MTPEYISEEVSMLIRNNLTNKEIREFCTLNEKSYHTIYALVYRQLTVSEKNKYVIEDILKEAKVKNISKLNRYKKDGVLIDNHINKMVY